MWISFSTDLKHWGTHKLMLEARRGAWWDANKIGLCNPPIETPRGWLVIYHGVRTTASGSLYRLGLVAPSGYLASEIPQQELEAKSMQASVDPLRATSLMILEQAVMAFGRQLLTRNDCPLCKVEYNLGEGSSLEWIDTDAEIIFQMCRERNRIGRDQ